MATTIIIICDDISRTFYENPIFTSICLSKIEKSLRFNSQHYTDFFSLSFLHTCRYFKFLVPHSSQCYALPMLPILVFQISKPCTDFSLIMAISETPNSKTHFPTSYTQMCTKHKRKNTIYVSHTPSPSTFFDFRIQKIKYYQQHAFTHKHKLKMNFKCNMYYSKSVQS